MPARMPDLTRGIRTGAGLTAVADQDFVDRVGRTPARSIAARAATAPSSAGWTFRSEPPYRPIGVRAAPTMTTLCGGAILPTKHNAASFVISRK